jgi:hypothetical protein
MRTLLDLRKGRPAGRPYSLKATKTTASSIQKTLRWF